MINHLIVQNLSPHIIDRINQIKKNLLYFPLKSSFESLDLQLVRMILCHNYLQSKSIYLDSLRI